MFDYLIKNARIFDGKNSPPYVSDLAIKSEKIAAVGDLGHAASKICIKANNLCLSPGFIDFHSHADFSLPACPSADSLVHQGVTTAVIGQCGESMAPLFEETRDQVVPFLSKQRPHIPFNKWSNFESYLQFYEDLPLSINTAFLVGQGTIRAGIVGFGSQPPSERHLREMKAAVTEAMAAGAFGVSTGLIYPPGSYATTEELIEIAKPAGDKYGFYFSHIRNEREQVIEAIEEAILIGKHSDTRVQISHLKTCWPANYNKQQDALDIIEKTAKEGIDVGADVYPYTASATSLVSLLPSWAQEGGPELILRRLADSEERKSIKRFMEKEGFLSYGDWKNIMISYCPAQKAYTGRFVADIAADSKVDPTDWVFDTLLKTNLEISQVAFVISEDNLRQVLVHPSVVIGSDSITIPDKGPLAQGCPHPRTFGPFPRILGHYVRELNLLSLEEAIYKMTGMPASRLGLSDRGAIEPGYKADLVIFDSEKIIDTATFEDPCHFPDGVHWVFCNGKPVLENGAITVNRPGQVLRHG